MSTSAKKESTDLSVVSPYQSYGALASIINYISNIHTVTSMDIIKLLIMFGMSNFGDVANSFIRAMSGYAKQSPVFLFNVLYNNIKYVRGIHGKLTQLTQITYPTEQIDVSNIVFIESDTLMRMLQYIRDQHKGAFYINTIGGVSKYNIETIYFIHPICDAPSGVASAPIPVATKSIRITYASKLGIEVSTGDDDHELSTVEKALVGENMRVIGYMRLPTVAIVGNKVHPIIYNQRLIDIYPRIVSRVYNTVGFKDPTDRCRESIAVDYMYNTYKLIRTSNDIRVMKAVFVVISMSRGCKPGFEMSDVDGTPLFDPYGHVKSTYQHLVDSNIPYSSDYNRQYISIRGTDNLSLQLHHTNITLVDINARNAIEKYVSATIERYVETSEFVKVFKISMVETQMQIDLPNITESSSDPAPAPQPQSQLFQRLQQLQMCQQLQEMQPMKRSIDTRLTDDKCNRNISTIYLPEGAEIMLLEGLKKFGDSELMRSMGITPKFNVMLYGPPGTGKTSTISAIATYLSRDIYYVDLSTIESGGELFDIYESICANNGIMVLEEIDTDVSTHARDVSVSSGTRSDTKSNDTLEKSPGKIRLETYLNILQGTLTKTNSVIIATTNHIEKLDPALIRSQRFDYKFKLGFCDRVQFERIYMKFAQREIPPNIMPLIDTSKFTPADVIEYLYNYSDIKSATDEEILEHFFEVGHSLGIRKKWY